MSDLGRWGEVWLGIARQHMSLIRDNLRKSDNEGGGRASEGGDGTSLMDLLGFLACVADLLIHNERCLGWGFCTVDSPLCGSPWDGRWTLLTNEAVRLYLDGGDVREALVEGF